jgi:hypothetical protein
MEVKMGVKFWIAFLVAFILLFVLEFVFHTLILGNFYLSHQAGFRPEGEMNWWMIVGFLLQAFIWTYFFNRFASKKNCMVGIQHGISYQVFLYVPRSFVGYSTQVLSGYCYLWWTIGAVVEGAIIGAVMGIILKEAEKA